MGPPSQTRRTSAATPSRKPLLMFAKSLMSNRYERTFISMAREGEKGKGRLRPAAIESDVGVCWFPPTAVHNHH